MNEKSNLLKLSSKYIMINKYNNSKSITNNNSEINCQNYNFKNFNSKINTTFTNNKRFKKILKNNNKSFDILSTLNKNKNINFQLKNKSKKDYSIFFKKKIKVKSVNNQNIASQYLLNKFNNKTLIRNESVLSVNNISCDGLYIKFNKLRNTYINPDSRVYTNILYNDNKIYLFGGYNTRQIHDLWEYNITENIWKKLKNKSLNSIPLINHYFKFDSNTDSIIIYGGNKYYSNGIEKYNNNFYVINNISDGYYNFERYKFSFEIPNKKKFGFCIIDNIAVVYAGLTDSNSFCKEGFMINFRNKKLKELTVISNPFKDGIQGHSLTVINYSNNINNIINAKNLQVALSNSKSGRYNEGIYLFGGTSSLNKYNKTLYNLKIFENNLIINKLSTAGKPPKGRIGHGSVFLKNINIYAVIGGKTKKYNNNNLISCLNIHTMIWITVKLNTEDFICSHFSLCSNEEVVYIFGGLGKKYFRDNSLFKLDFLNIN